MGLVETALQLVSHRIDICGESPNCLGASRTLHIAAPSSDARLGSIYEAQLTLTPHSAADSSSFAAGIAGRSFQPLGSPGAMWSDTRA